MTSYCGRFAPSPTGPLHFGSLVAALASCLEARARDGKWLVRMEDLDRPREQPNAAASILRTLEAFGFEWHGSVMFQSARADAYARALARLDAGGALFACACTRREIADSGLAREGERVYPGTCRHGMPTGRPPRAIRVRVGEDPIEFADAIQGRVRQNLQREVGDYVVKRADGAFAYQLAVVVDDAEQGISDVVRGADLLDSTPRQIHLQRLLGLPTPRYAHLPAALNARGEKLSKQTQAVAIDPARASCALVAALDYLGQAPPRALARAAATDVWNWATENWMLARVPKLSGMPAPPGF